MDMSRMKSGCLIINKRKHPVFEGLNPIGRNKQSTVIITDHTVSHQQATIVIIKDKHYVCDMNSCNGTQLDHIKLLPLHLYEINDKAKIYFGNVKAVYETVFQDSNLQERSQLSQMNDGLFDVPTQSLSATDVATYTGNSVDRRAIGDHSRFESCTTVRTEPYISNIIEPPINEENIRNIEAALQKETSRSSKNDEKKEEATEAGGAAEVSSLTIHDLPTQLMEGDFDEASCSSSVLGKCQKDIKKDGMETQLSIHDMPTQIDYEPYVSKQVNEELRNLPDRTWDEDFFAEAGNSIHNEQTQLITPIEISATTEQNNGKTTDGLPSQTTILSEKDMIYKKNKNIKWDEEKQLEDVPKSSDSEEADESAVIEETIINDTTKNNEEEDVEDDCSNCSADFLTTEPATQFFEDNRPATTLQVFTLQGGVKSVTPFDNENPPNESIENNDSGSTTSNKFDKSPTTSKLGSKSSDDNFASSLRTSLLKRRVRNAITSDDESKKTEGSSEETDVDMVPVSEENFSLNSNLLKHKVRNIIASDDEEKKDGESSDETDVESSIKNAEQSVSEDNGPSHLKVELLKNKVRNIITSDSEGEKDKDNNEQDKEKFPMKEDNKEIKKTVSSSSSSSENEKVSGENFSLNPNLLKHRSRNAIISDDEQKQKENEKKDGESSDETDVESPIKKAEPPISENNCPSPLKVEVLKNKIRNIITSDSEEEKEKGKNEKNKEKFPMKEANKEINKTVSSSSSSSSANEITANRRKKLTKKSPLKNNQKKSDSDSEGGDNEIIIKKKKSLRKLQKVVEVNNDDENSETDVEKDQPPKDVLNPNSTLNDSDLIPSTQTQIPSLLASLQRKPQVNKPIIASGESANTDESVDYSLDLMLTESLVVADDQSSTTNEKSEKSVKKACIEIIKDNTNANIEVSRSNVEEPSEKLTDSNLSLMPTKHSALDVTQSSKPNKKIEESTEKNDMIDINENTSVRADITVIENDDDDIFEVATQLIPSSKAEIRSFKSAVSLANQVGDVDDDIFLQATQEISRNDKAERGNLKCNKKKQPVENVGTISFDGNDMDINDEDSDVFLQPTQVVNQGCNTNKNNENDDIFMQATQPLAPARQTIVAKETEARVEKKTTTEDSLFLQPTKPMVSKSKISECRLASIERLKEKITKHPVSNSIDYADDIFMQATQPLSINSDQHKINKPAVSTTIGRNISTEATQVVTNDDKNLPSNDKGDDEDDIYLQATQPVTLSKDNAMGKGNKNDDTDIYLRPTQDLSAENVLVANLVPPTSESNPDFKKAKLKICKFPVIQVRGDIFDTPTRKTDTVEAAMQRLFQSQQTQDDAFFRQTRRINPSIESQLEVLFASQSQSGVRNECRPQNPLANILENLQLQHEIVIPLSEENEEEEGTSGKRNDIRIQWEKEHENIKEQHKSKDQDKIKDQEKGEGQDKNKTQHKSKEQDKVMEPEKGKEYEKNKDQEKKDQDDKVKEANGKGDKEKSKSHKKSEKGKHRGESKNKDKESTDAKDSDEKKDKKHEKKSRNEEDLVEILQASKVEKEKARKQTRRTSHQADNPKESQDLKEKLPETSRTRDNSPDHYELAKKTDKKNLKPARSLEYSKLPMMPDDSIKIKSLIQNVCGSGLIPLIKIESLESINTRRNRASLSSKESTAIGEDDAGLKSKQQKKTRASSNPPMETKHIEEFEKKVSSKRRPHSSSPLEYGSPRSDTNDNKRKQLKTRTNEDESKSDVSTEKPRSTRGSTVRTEIQEPKEIENKQQKNGSAEREKEGNEMETDKSKKPTRRSHRTQKRFMSPSPQRSDGTIGDSTAKSSESLVIISDEPNSPSGDNTASSHSLRRSKRKTNSDHSSHKSKLKKQKKESELSLIEELPEWSERIDLSRPSVEVIDPRECNSGADPKKVEQAKIPKKEIEKTPTRASRSSCRIAQSPSSTATLSTKPEDDNSAVVVKRTRQKHRRHSSNSEDDFVVKVTSKRSKLDIPAQDAAPSSNPSDHTFSTGSSFSDTPEKSKRKIKPKVVFTMMDSPELESLIRRLGGSVVDSVESSTVLMTINVKRSQKLLAAVGQGKPICSPAWLQECKKANKFLDPRDYILRDPEAEKKWNFSLEESLSRSRNTKLFESYTFLLLISTAADVLRGAIEACGGKCVARCPAKYQEIKNFVIVSSEETKAKHSKFLKQDPRPTIVAAEAIFDAVLRQEINFESHLLM